MEGDFGGNFRGLRFSRNKARKVLERFGETSEQEYPDINGSRFGIQIGGVYRLASAKRRAYFFKSIRVRV